MLRRCGMVLVGLSGAWLIAAGCAASGSTDVVNGPMYDFDTGVVDGGPTIDSSLGADAGAPTGSSDAHSPGDAAEALEAASSTDSATGQGADGSDANGLGDDGGGCTSTIALLGGSASQLVAAIEIGTGPFATQTVAGSTTTTPALVAFSGGYQALVTESGDAGGGNALFGLGYSGGTWSPPTSLDASALGAPSVAAVGSALQAVYLNPSHFYFQATYGTSWSADAISVQPPNDAGVQAFGPVSPAAAGTSTQLVIAYEGNDLLPYAQTWTSGAGWDDGVALGSATLVANTAMAVVTLDTGDLLAVYVAAGGSCSNTSECLYAVTGSGATPRTWSAPAMVNLTAFSPYAPTLAPMSGGRAILAWKGGNGEGYESVYSGGATPTWSAPAQLTSATLAAAPSIAPGVCGGDAVAAYVSSGEVYTTALAGGAWSTPALQSAFSGATAVSIATAP